MNVAGIFNLGSAEIILILTLTLILLGAKKLRESGEGLRRGIKEFKEGDREPAGDPLLVALAIILTATCVTFVLYEFSK